MKILVTGATGFIGSNLVRRLIGDDHDVIILKRSTSDIWRIRSVFNKITIYDLDKIALKEIKDEKIEVIIHLATNYGRNNERIDEMIQSNIAFPAMLIDNIIGKNLKGFVNTDSSLPGSVSFYASTKKAFLSLLDYYHKETGLNVINLRLEYVYGPQDDDSKFVPFLIKNILAEKSVDATPGMQKRDFIFVDDVVEAYVHVVDQIEKMDRHFVSIDIGTGKSITLRDFAAMAEKLAGKKSNIRWGALPYRKNEILNSTADIRKAKEILNWQSETTLEVGLKKTIRWYENNHH